MPSRAEKADKVKKCSIVQHLTNDICYHTSSLSDPVSA